METSIKRKWETKVYFRRRNITVDKDEHLIMGKELILQEDSVTLNMYVRTTANTPAFT